VSTLDLTELLRLGIDYSINDSVVSKGNKTIAKLSYSTNPTETTVIPEQVLISTTRNPNTLSSSDETTPSFTTIETIVRYLILFILKFKRNFDILLSILIW
jgi:hypothetical protein